jgi:serine protease Do
MKKKWRWYRLTWGLLAGLVLSGCLSTGGGGERVVLRAKDRVAPALVHIRPVKQVFARGKKQEMLTIGSGFIVSPEGMVLTNEHVAGESSLVLCVLNDRSEVEAEVLGVDPFTDIAVLKLNVDHPLPYVQLGDSDILEAGQTVMALGSPHGLSRSVSLGIISVTGRYLPGQGAMSAPFNTWIQTDAAINPGNSGGPLVNLRGQVVGVNSRKLTGADNMGFAIPVNLAQEVMASILAEGRVRRSWLGLRFQEMLAKTDDADQRGVVIADVAPMSPAGESGLRPGDVLVSVNGDAVHARFEEDLPAVRKRIADLTVGEEALLGVFRNGEVVEIKVTTEERSALKGSEKAFEEWGFTARELTPDIVRRAQLERREGVLISGAQPGGLASTAGLKPGDIVLKVDEETVKDLSDFARRYDDLLERKPSLSLFYVKRGALTRFVIFKAHQGEEGEAGNAE